MSIRQLFAGLFQIEQGLELFTAFVVDGKTALEQIISRSETDKSEKAEKTKKGHVGDVLGKTLKHVRFSLD